jgi:non-ribosomal peptide synthetase component F
MRITMADPLQPEPSEGSAARPLTPAERQVLAEWNDTARDVPAVTWPELFRAQAARTPDAPAVIFQEECLSYAELNARANRLARYLISLGAGPERLVAIAVPRSAEMIVAVLAVLKAGAAYVPVDPSYPADRIAFMLADTHPVAVLTTVEAGLGLPHGTPLVAVDDPGRLLVGRAQLPCRLHESSRPQPRRPVLSSPY